MEPLRFEPRGLPEDVAVGLKRRGHVLTEGEPMGSVNAIGIDATGRWTGASDPRDEGVALGY